MIDKLRRRDLLTGTAAVVIGQSLARASVISTDTGEPAKAGPWQYFTPAEGAQVEALVDRIIPPDAQTPGGKGAGCAVFIDRQLAGPFGRHEGWYTLPPFVKGIKQQGPQSSKNPAQLYRSALAALERYCRGQPGGKSLAELPAEKLDEILQALESSTLQLQGDEGKTFFEALLTDTQEGFFADPIYGGNRDMCAWKMIGFPGARYDYRDWVGRHNERYPHPPVSIAGRADWTPKRR
ncbi:MAG TPA: gluconate 2-dehydrogenase subunit 3 family protein [Steroidobacteraceae bacterium]|jgi:gluconate 2-dehydrogenase gamma chain